MIPVIAAPSTPPSQPGVPAETNAPHQSASSSGISSKAKSEGQSTFSAMLTMLRSGTRPSASGSAATDSTDTVPNAPATVPAKAPSLDRADGKTRTSGSFTANPNAAIAANMLQTSVKAPPTPSKADWTTSANAIVPTQASSLPQLGIAHAGDSTAVPAPSTEAATSMAQTAPKQAAEDTHSAFQPANLAAPNAAAEATHSVFQPANLGPSNSAGTLAPTEKQVSDTLPAPPTPTPLAPVQVNEQPALPSLPTIAPTADAPAHENDSEPTAAKASATAAGTSANVVESPRLEQVAQTAPANPAPPLAHQIHDQIANQMDQLRQMGRVEMQLNLHPPELGRVQLHLTLEDGQLNVRMLVQDESAKRLIDQQLEPLRVRFSEMGVSVGQFDVRRDGNSAHPEQQQPAEPSAQALQADSRTGPRLQKPYAKVGNADALVDLIA